MRGERRGVAVVEVEPERPGVELVGERLAGLDQPAADLLAEARHAVHLRGVDAVEVDRVRVRAAVAEADPQPVSVDAAERRPGDAAVERPGGVPARRERSRSPCRPRRDSTRAACARRASCDVRPQSKSRTIRLGSKPLAALSTTPPRAKPAWPECAGSRRRIVIHAGHVAGGGGRSRTTELRGPGRHRAERRGQRREHLPSRECNHRACRLPWPSYGQKRYLVDSKSSLSIG